MALNKEITSKTGVTTNYHKIDNLRMDKVFELVRVPEDHPNYDPDNTVTEKQFYYSISFRLLSYVNVEIRTMSEMLAAESKEIRVRASIDEGDNTPIFNLAYNKLKELERYKGAIDC